MGVAKALRLTMPVSMSDGDLKSIKKGCSWYLDEKTTREAISRNRLYPIRCLPMYRHSSTLRRNPLDTSGNSEIFSRCRFIFLSTVLRTISGNTGAEYEARGGEQEADANPESVDSSERFVLLFIDDLLPDHSRNSSRFFTL